MNPILEILNTIAHIFASTQQLPLVATCSSSSCTCCNEEEHVPNTPNIAPCSFALN